MATVSLRGTRSRSSCRSSSASTRRTRPGNETAAAELLRAYLEDSGAECRAVRADSRAGEPRRADPRPRRRADASVPVAHGRRARRRGRVDRRSRSAGELRGGEIWGRGALDMKGEVAASAVAIASLAREGFEPAGDLIFAATADEEVGAGFGAAVVVRGASGRSALRLSDQRGVGRAARARRQAVLHVLGRREDERAVPAARARPQRPRVDARHRRTTRS